jgi:ribosome-associated translation inhibitor RaiA
VKKIQKRKDKTMQIVISHKNVKSVDAQDSFVEQQLFALANRLQIDEAHVVFERRWDGTPPYRVGIHIVTPGPDVMAEGEDQTLQAAMLKSLRQLETKARHRAERPGRRVRSNLQAPPLGRQGVRR